MPLLPTIGPPPPLATPDTGATGAGRYPPETVRAARDFEAAFLAEALSHMGLDAARGVEGAAPFASFVNRAYADQLAERGGVGLAESIVRSLAQNDQSAQG